MTKKKISAKATVTVDFDLTLSITLGEAKALEAIVGYGHEEFKKVFYEKLGKAYLSPHENDMISLFESLRAQLPGIISKVETLADELQKVMGTTGTVKEL